MKRLLIALSAGSLVAGSTIFGSAYAGDLGVADLTVHDIERFTGKRDSFDALCGTAERAQPCTVALAKGRLVVNGSSSIAFSSIYDLTLSRGGDDPGPTGHRLWGKGLDQTAVFYKDANGAPSLAVFGFEHATTWMHFNLNLVAAKNGIAFN